jgi:hypothetical protein
MQMFSHLSTEQEMNQQHRNFKRLRILALIGLIALFLSVKQFAQAGEHYPGCGSAHYLQIAVANSNVNGEDDYIGLEAADCIYDLRETLVIKPDGGKSVLIEGNGAIISGVNARRLFKVEPGATLILMNVAIRHGKADYGGAIYNEGDLNLRDTTVYGNKAKRGAAIYNAGGTVSILATNLYGNEAEEYGGSIYSTFGSTFYLTNSSISENKAAYGAGGIFNEAKLTINNSTISNNSTDFMGGGLYNTGGTFTLMNSTVHANTAQRGGAGIYNSGTFTISASTISANVTQGNGGGVFNANPGNLIVERSLFSDNHAVAANGGALFNAAAATFTSTTVWGNTADYAAGIFNSGSWGTITLVNTTIANNGAVNGTGGFQNEGGVNIGNSIIANNTPFDCWNSGTITSIGPTLVRDGGCNIPNALTGDPMLGALSSTSPAYLPLLPGSKAIDAGNSNCATTDQRGVARPIDGNSDGAAQCDLGAFEADSGTSNSPTATDTHTSTPTPTDIPVNTVTPAATSTLTANTPFPTTTLTPPMSQTELIVNGGFDQTGSANKLSPWIVKNQSGDKIKCNQSNQVIAHSGPCTFMFKGNSGEKATLTQTLALDNITFAENQGLSLTLFANTNNPTLKAKVKLIVEYTDPTVPVDRVSINLRKTSGYELFTGDIALKSGAVSKIKIQISHRSSSGKLYIDSVSLQKIQIERGLLPLP